MAKNLHPLVDKTPRPVAEKSVDLEPFDGPIQGSAGDPFGVDELENNPVESRILPRVVVEIRAPEHAAKVPQDETIYLRASASEDSKDVSSQVRWRSSIDGFLGIGRKIAVELSAGVHTLSASILHSMGRKTTATIGVTTVKKITDPTDYVGDDTHNQSGGGGG